MLLNGYYLRVTSLETDSPALWAPSTLGRHYPGPACPMVPAAPLFPTPLRSSSPTQGAHLNLTLSPHPLEGTPSPVDNHMVSPGQAEGPSRAGGCQGRLQGPAIPPCLLTAGEKKHVEFPHKDHGCPPLRGYQGGQIHLREMEL